MTGGGAGTHPTGAGGTGPGRESDDPEDGPPALPVFAEAIAAAKAQEPDILRELEALALAEAFEPAWPTTDMYREGGAA